MLALNVTTDSGVVLQQRTRLQAAAGPPYELASHIGSQGGLSGLVKLASCKPPVSSPFLSCPQSVLLHSSMCLNEIPQPGLTQSLSKKVSFAHYGFRKVCNGLSC